MNGGTFNFTGGTLNVAGAVVKNTGVVNNFATAGAVWSNTQMNLNNAFDLQFYVNLTGGAASWNADGMAFVMQGVGTGALGGAGNGLGYGGAPQLAARTRSTTTSR